MAVINSGSPFRIYWLSRPQAEVQNYAQLAHSIRNTHQKSKIFISAEQMTELITKLNLERQDNLRIIKHSIRSLFFDLYKR
jgi:hypothetical protein